LNKRIVIEIDPKEKCIKCQQKTQELSVSG
jgi:hypothetical protein